MLDIKYIKDIAKKEKFQKKNLFFGNVPKNEYYPNIKRHL